MSDNSKEQLSKFQGFRRKLLKASGFGLAYMSLYPFISSANANTKTNVSPDAGLTQKASLIDSNGEALNRLGNMVDKGASEAELSKGVSVIYLNQNETGYDSLSYTKASVKDGNVVVNSMTGDDARFTGVFEIENSVYQPSEDGKSVKKLTEKSSITGEVLSATITKDREVCKAGAFGISCDLNNPQAGETKKELDGIAKATFYSMRDAKKGNQAASDQLDKKKGLYAVSEGDNVIELHCTLAKKPNAWLYEKKKLLKKAQENLEKMTGQDLFQPNVSGNAKYKNTSVKTIPTSTTELPSSLVAFLLDKNEDKNLATQSNASGVNVAKNEATKETSAPAPMDRREFLQKITLANRTKTLA
jgi:hypothetical protein